MVSTEIADRAAEVLERENEALREELSALQQPKDEEPEEDEDEGASSIPPMDAAWAAAFAAVPEATALQASGHLDFRKYRGGLYGFGNGLFRAKLHHGANLMVEHAGHPRAMLSSARGGG